MFGSLMSLSDRNSVYIVSYSSQGIFCLDAGICDVICNIFQDKYHRLNLNKIKTTVEKYILKTWCGCYKCDIKSFMVIYTLQHDKSNIQNYFYNYTIPFQYWHNSPSITHQTHWNEKYKL